MIKFYYTQHRVNCEETFDTLDKAIDALDNHFWKGLSCAQMIVDFNKKEIYLVSDSIFDSVLKERDGNLEFDHKNFKKIVISI